MSEQLVDQQSRQRIKSDLTRNQLVEAGAGSGKTQMMAERMAAGVASGVYQVPQMAAVTFTRKAAAELRGRFQLALEAELTKATDAEPTKRLRDALSNIERFFAGTIHSFCAHLLRERPVEAVVSPGFTELDEVEDTRLRRQSWRDYRSQLKSAGDPLMLDLVEAGLKASDLDRAFDTVCLYEEVEFPAGTAARPDASSAASELDRFWTALQTYLPVPFNRDSTCNIQKNADKFRGQLRVTPDYHKAAVDLAPLLETWDCASKIVQYQWSEDAAEKKRINKEVPALHEAFRRDTVAPFLKQWRQYVYRLSISVLTQAREHAKEERRRVNTLNYGDLLQLAAKVLRENASVRAALGEKYRWVFVDEFQDTDPVQAEIMFLLAADDTAAAKGSADWRSVNLRPGSLFVVGDPKQSIYRFRRADIDIYNEVRARLDAAPNGDVLPLTSNFRSVGSLCDWANTVFEREFPTEPSLRSPKFARLDPVDRKPTGASGLFTLSIPAAVDKGNIASAESEAIACYIHTEVAAKRRKFGDFLILTRKRKDLELYANALERLQIPAEVSGAGAFGDSVEVRQLALLLKALADPQDAVSLVGVLRGPLFGLSDRDLFAYRQAGGWFSVFADAPNPAPVGAQRVAGAIASLRMMHRWTQILPIGAAVERILEDSGYLALAATTPGGVEAGDLLHAVDRVRSIVETGHTLADAADALEPDADESSEVESLSLEPGRTDVVRLMNLHKAKGLEAPVVFLANPLSGTKPRVDARIIRDGPTARGYFKIMKEFGQGQKVVGEPTEWDRYEAEELAYLAAEEKRLLYVAATRAKDMLVIGRWMGKTSTAGPWGVFGGFFQTATDLPVPSSAVLDATQAVDLSPAAATAAAHRVRAAHQRALKPSWAAASVTTETKAFPKLVADLDADADDPTRVITDNTPSRRADAGAAWGALIHGLLEHALRHHTVTAADLRRLGMWLTVDELTLRPFLDEAVATVQAVSKSEFWTEANASPECYQEVPFAIRVMGEDGITPKVINGTIDSVFRTTEGWKIVDYKTDLDGTPEVLKERYGKQLAAYEDAWRRFTADPVSSSLVATRITTA
jgi:ATP-dependent helicase/nuclease subunit A